MTDKAAEIDVRVTCPLWRRAVADVEDVCRRAALGALAPVRTPWPGIEASLVLADDELVWTLNREFRDCDRTTNVLAFPGLPEGPQPPGAPVLLGDVVIAYETAATEAAADGMEMSDHLCHLVVHGMLHLLGYDHQSEAEAAEMERLEVGVLAGLGVDNPYAGEPASGCGT